MQSQETTSGRLDWIYPSPTLLPFWPLDSFVQLYFDTLESRFKNLFSTWHWGNRPKAGVDLENVDVVATCNLEEATEFAVTQRSHQRQTTCQFPHYQHHAKPMSCPMREMKGILFGFPNGRHRGACPASLMNDNFHIFKFLKYASLLWKGFKFSAANPLRKIVIVPSLLATNCPPLISTYDWKKFNQSRKIRHNTFDKSVC